MEYRALLSAGAVVLTVFGYAPYIRDVRRGSTVPHPFTWFIAALAGCIELGLQVVGGAGVGALPLFTATSICIVIFFISLKFGTMHIVASDVMFLILSIVSLLLWVMIRQPVYAVILINLVEVLGFVPTMRKAWRNPYSETLLTFEVCALRQAITVLALQNINVLTASTPILCASTNMTIIAILLKRRR